jgi:hypothetical protein
MAATARNDADQILPVFLELGALEWIDLVTDYANNHRRCPLCGFGLDRRRARLAAKSERRRNRRDARKCPAAAQRRGRWIFQRCVLLRELSCGNVEQLLRVCAAFDNDTSVAVEIWMWNDL